MRVRPVLAATAVVLVALIGGSHLPQDGQNPATIVTADYTVESASATAGHVDPASDSDAAPPVASPDTSAPGADAASKPADDRGAATSADGSASGVPCSTPTGEVHDGTGAAQLPTTDGAANRHLAGDSPWDGAVSDIRDLLQRILGASANASTPPADASTEVPPTGPPFSSASTAGPPAGGRADLPSDVLKLSDWYLTLPTGKQGDPDTVQNPNLEKFTDEFFELNPTRNGVVFRATGDGVTTKNSHYPRSELREMDGATKAAWTNTAGSHTLDVCEAITKVPAAKPEVVSAQIHDDTDDVLQIHLDGQKLTARYDNDRSEAVLDPAYKLGTPFHVRVVAADSKVYVLYNGQQKAELPLSGSGWYWKVGAYVQSNPSKGDGAGSEGDVVVYSLDTTHTQDVRPGEPPATAQPSTTDGRPSALDDSAVR